MKVLLALIGAIIGLLLLIIILLCIKIGFYGEIIYTKKDGFNFSGKITFLMFCKKLNKRKKPKPEQMEKEKKKTDVKIIPTVKNAACIVKELSFLPQKVLVFKKLCLWMKVSLEDPMKNGIVYGAVSGTLIQAMQMLVNHFKTEEYKIRAVPDFVDRDGISVKNITWVQVRPIVLIINLIYAYNNSEKLREAVRYFINMTRERKEENEQR